MRHRNDPDIRYTKAVDFPYLTTRKREEVTMCNYFDNVFVSPQATIDVICHELKNPKFGRIDFIVGSGLSGNLLLVPISIKSGIPFAVVRKEADFNKPSSDGGCHSGSLVETQFQVKSPPHSSRFVIIDDFTSAGSTVIRIDLAIKDYLKQQTECAGLIFYQTECPYIPEKLVGIPASGLKQQVKEMKDHVRESVIVRELNVFGEVVGTRNVEGE